MTMGALKLYENVIRPLYHKHSGKVDNALNCKLPLPPLCYPPTNPMHTFSGPSPVRGAREADLDATTEDRRRATQGSRKDFIDLYPIPYMIALVTAHSPLFTDCNPHQLIIYPLPHLLIECRRLTTIIETLQTGFTCDNLL